MSTYDKHKKYLMPRYQERMQAMRDYLGGVCAYCGSTDRLEIDHIDPATKSFTLSKKWGTSWDVILQELEKCQLLCYTCHHSIKTSAEMKSKTPWNKGNVNHGTHTMRYTHKCKCDECQNFHIKRMTSRRKK